MKNYNFGVKLVRCLLIQSLLPEAILQCYHSELTYSIIKANNKNQQF